MNHADLSKIDVETAAKGHQVYELAITDHVPYVDPKTYNLELDGIDPSGYFLTSGDAVEKTRVLERDLWSLAGALRRHTFELLVAEHNCTSKQAEAMCRKGTYPTKPTGYKEFEQGVWRAAGAARKLLNLLITIRGDNCFLETEYLPDHRLIITVKNPRDKSDAVADKP